MLDTHVRSAMQSARTFCISYRLLRKIHAFISIIARARFTNFIIAWCKTIRVLRDSYPFHKLYHDVVKQRKLMYKAETL